MDNTEIVEAKAAEAAAAKAVAPKNAREHLARAVAAYDEIVKRCAVDKGGDGS